MTRSCDRCEGPLETDGERDDQLCRWCADALYEAYQEREDFTRFHPGPQAKAEDTERSEATTAQAGDAGQ